MPPNSRKWPKPVFDFDITSEKCMEKSLKRFCILKNSKNENSSPKTHFLELEMHIFDISSFFAKTWLVFHQKKSRNIKKRSFFAENASYFRQGTIKKDRPLIARLSEGSLVDRVRGWHMMTFFVTEDVTIFWIHVSQSDGSLVDYGQIFLWF